MSGPKGGSYRVVSAAEIARRRLAAALAASRAIEELVAEADERAAFAAAAYGIATIRVRVPKRPRSTDPERIEHWVERTREAVRAADAEIATAITAEREARLASAVAALAGSLEVVAPTSPAVAAAPTPAAEEEPAWKDEVATSVRRSVATLDADCPAAAAEAIEAIAADAIAARSKVEGRRLADLVGNDVGRANRAAAARRAFEDRRRRCLEALDAWAHPAAAAAAAWIAAARPDTPLSDLDERTSTAVAAAAADRDRAIVADAVRQSLQKLGYVVEEGFETVVVDRGVAHVRAPAWPDHAVRVRLYGERPRVSFAVVARTDGHDEVRDQEVEREWCSDIGAVTAALGSHGVDLELTELTPVGSVPVQVLAEDAFPFPRAEAVRRTAPVRHKERGR